MNFLYFNTIGDGDQSHATKSLQALSIQSHWQYNGRIVFKNYLTCLSAVFLFSVCQLIAQSSPIYVDQQATGSNTGQNWEHAYTNLQEAIAEAEYGDTIWVAQGIYKPTTTNDRMISFRLNNGVAMIGGFKGDETALDQRELTNHETILSGDIGVADDSLDNSYHVVYALGIDSTTLLDGFTVTAGVANFEDFSFTSTFQLGGGMLLDTNDDLPVSNPIIQNCIFIENSALRGGGLYIKSSEKHQAYPQIKHCEFRNNFARNFGGGLFKSGDAQSPRPMVVYDCKFSQNITQNRGGGIFVNAGHWNLRFQKIVFESNRSMGSGGAIALNNSAYDGQVEIDSCLFRHNTGNLGTAIHSIIEGVPFLEMKNFSFHISNSYFEDSGTRNGSNSIRLISARVFDSTRIEHCTFKNNNSGDFAAVIEVESFSRIMSTLNIDHCQFIVTPSSTISGKAIHFKISGTPFLNTLQIKNTLFLNIKRAITIENISGAITAKVFNSTFVNNRYQVVLYQSNSDSNDPDVFTKAEIANSIFWSPPAQHAKIYSITSPNNSPTMYGFNLHHNLFSTNPCDLPGGEEACQENNLFNVNPQFRDSLNGDFRLAGCSPAINAGLNTLVNTENDLVGQPRIMEGKVDLGAYEQELFDLDITKTQVQEVSCFGEQDGQIQLSTNGTPPLQYTWTTAGMTGMGNEQLSPGLYAVTITDSLLCQENLFIQIDEPDSLQATFSLIPSADDQMNGSITLEQVQGGRPPYQWAWSTGDNAASLSNLPNGNYALTLTDQNGCTQSWNFELERPDAITTLKSDFAISLFPNPIQTEKSFTIQYSLLFAQQYQFSLLDPMGRNIAEQSHRLQGTGQLTWPLFSAPPGMYLLQVSSAIGEVLTLQKLLIVE